MPLVLGCMVLLRQVSRHCFGAPVGPDANKARGATAGKGGHAEDRGGVEGDIGIVVKVRDANGRLNEAVIALLIVCLGLVMVGALKVANQNYWRTK